MVERAVVVVFVQGTGGSGEHVTAEVGVDAGVRCEGCRDVVGPALREETCQAEVEGVDVVLVLVVAGGVGGGGVGAGGGLLWLY